VVLVGAAIDVETATFGNKKTVRRGAMRSWCNAVYQLRGCPNWTRMEFQMFGRTSLAKVQARNCRYPDR
jgi:hypothetical protein